MFRKCRFYIWSLEISCMLCKLIRKRHGVKDRHRKSLYKTPRKLSYPQIWDMSKSLNSKSWDPTFLITEEKSITMSLTNYKKHLKGWRILWQVSRWRQHFVIFQTSVRLLNWKSQVAYVHHLWIFRHSVFNYNASMAQNTFSIEQTATSCLTVYLLHLWSSTIPSHTRFLIGDKTYAGLPIPVCRISSLNCCDFLWVQSMPFTSSERFSQTLFKAFLRAS